MGQRSSLPATMAEAAQPGPSLPAKSGGEGDKSGGDSTSLSEVSPDEEVIVKEKKIPRQERQRKEREKPKKEKKISRQERRRKDSGGEGDKSEEDELKKLSRQERRRLQREKAKEERRQGVGNILNWKRHVERFKGQVKGFKQEQSDWETRRAELQQQLREAVGEGHRRELERELKRVEGEIQRCKRRQEYYQKLVEENKEILQSTSQGQEEAYRELVAEAMQQGYVNVRIIKVIIIGPAGVGKTCLKFLLLGKKPPNIRCSTPLAEKPIRAVSGARIKLFNGGWHEVSEEQLLAMIADAIPILYDTLAEEEELPPELLEALQQVPPGDSSVGNKAQDTSADSQATVASGDTTLPQSDTTSSSTSQKATASILEELRKKTLESAEKEEKRRQRKERRRQREERRRQREERRRQREKHPQIYESSSKESLSEESEEPEESLSEESLSEESEEESKSHHLLDADWIQFVDSGGQPQFHELLPIFIRNTSATVFVLRLSDRLDEKPTVEYYNNHGQPVGTPYKAPLTNEEILKCMVRTMQSKRTEGDNPKVLVVGTHKDRESECSESRSEKNDKLCKIFCPHMQDDLTFYGKKMKEVIFPVNTIEPKEEEQRIAGELRKAIESCAPKPVKIPIWWYILELILQRLASLLNRRMLSKKQCLQVAHRLGFHGEALEVALKYLSKLNIIFYDPQVLPNVVFTDSTVHLDKITELVEYSHKLRDKKECEAHQAATMGKWRRFRDQGILSLEFLKDEKFLKHYIEGLFTPEDLLKLLQELLVLASLPKEEYFMPSLLEMLPVARVSEIRQSSSTTEPLLIHFSHGWPRSGIFCCLVTFLIAHKGWKVLLPSGDPILVSRNVIKFLPLSLSPPCTVTLIDSFARFEVHIYCEASLADSQSLYPTIKQAVFDGIHKASAVLRYNNAKPKAGIFCPHKRSKNGQSSPKAPLHAALLPDDFKWWRCTENERLSDKLNEQQSVWFKQEQNMSSVQTKPEESGATAASGAFRKCSAALRKAIGDPEDLAWELYSADVIAEDIVDRMSLPGLTPREKNSVLLSAVRDQIAVDPSKFHKVLETFKENKAMTEITKQLETTYQELMHK